MVLACYTTYMSQQIVILAAGKGTRMAGATEVLMPKVLIPLGQKPVITHLLETVKDVPQDTAPIIVVGFMKDMVQSTLGDGYIYVEQFDQKGTAHAVLSAKDAVTAENIIVLNGDMPFISKESLSKLAELHKNAQAKVSMFTCQLPNFENDYQHFLSYGRIIRNSDNEVIKIQEYKDCTDDQKKITEVNTGEYIFNSAWLWDKLAQIGHSNSQDEFYLTDIIEIAITDAQKIQSLSIAPEEVYGINTPDNLIHAQSLIK